MAAFDSVESNSYSGGVQQCLQTQLRNINFRQICAPKPLNQLNTGNFIQIHVEIMRRDSMRRNYFKHTIQ